MKIVSRAAIFCSQKIKSITIKLKNLFYKEPCVGPCEYKAASGYGYVYCVKCGHGAGP